MAATIRPVTGKKVFFYFLAFFVAIAAVNAVFITKALKTHSGVVSESAYEDGLAYNDRLHAGRVQEALGLTENLVHENGTLTWTIQDKNGAPLTGAKVTARMIRPLKSGHDYEIEFTQVAKGVYSVPLNAPLSGAWTVKANAQWDTHNYQTTLEIIAP